MDIVEFYKYVELINKHYELEKEEYDKIKYSPSSSSDPKGTGEVNRAYYNNV